MTWKEVWDNVKLMINWFETLPKTTWEGFWNYMKLVHSASDEASSKRFYGGMGFISSLVILFLVALKIIPGDVWESIQGAWETVLFVSTGAIGLGTFERYYTKKQDTKVALSNNTNKPT